MNDFRAGQSSSSDIKYFNLLAEATTGDNALVTRNFMSLVNAGRLPKQYFYVLGHGTPDALSGYKVNGKYNHYYKKESDEHLQKLLDDIKSKGYTEGQTIVFIACQLGNKRGSFAEIFSKRQGVGTVYAFTSLGWMAVPFFVAAQFRASDQSYTTAKRVYGHWRIFNTAAAAKIKRPTKKSKKK